jgi:hypothetical protein
MLRYYLLCLVASRTPVDHLLNYSAFIGQLGWPNLQNEIGLFSPKQAGQKISPQPEQGTPEYPGQIYVRSRSSTTVQIVL